ncbi:CPBP family intramembrane glutamic endopeptidase [Furfurilactobacillus cerevisiae]|uniref:CPBP family intramembrane glutamic endopeptidase n=1 Tax=Furfurilactobacillus rossiae TaxID=231049 RepID=UPI003B97EF0B
MTNDNRPFLFSWLPRVLEVASLWIMVQLPPTILAFASKTTFANASGYILLAAFWGSFLICIWIAYRRFRHWSGERLFHDFKLRDVGVAILAYLAIIFSEAILMRLQQVLYHTQSTENNQAISSIMKTSPVAMVGFGVSAVLLTPFLEELVFRGVITNIFFKRNNLWAKVLLSGVLFSSGHISGNPISFLLYFMMGSILAFTYQKTHKQFNSIMVHFMINAVAITQLLSMMH